MFPAEIEPQQQRVAAHDPRAGCSAPSGPGASRFKRRTFVQLDGNDRQVTVIWLGSDCSGTVLDGIDFARIVGL